MMKGADRIKKVRTPYVRADLRNCKACWRCVEACPKRIIGKVGFLWHRHIVFNDSDNCSGCKKCIKVCPYGVFSHQ
jgi:Uncharacterized anaerobic dehydrogenase